MESVTLVPTNFPLQLTSFIGRERGMTEVKRLLAATRLVTLTGSGGCGKTRFALQVASDLLDTFPDGVWLVEFAAVSDPALVPQAIAAALGVRELPAHSLSDSLVQFLRAKNLSLVIDNCEHLIEACARVADQLLRACAPLRILATSREALGVGGETVWRVPSLDVPNIGSALPANTDLVSALTQFEAARLFVDRALAALPTFLLTNRNAPAVAEVCRRLDGIPLAIELAAARVKTLSVEEIAARLNDCFDLLTGGSRTALPRHQTLRASMDWSHALLTVSEQILFRRLSVFAGGWTLSAAQVVGGRDSSASDQILDLLSSLVNKSLVVAEEQDGQTRYRMLEAIQQYARAELAESREAQMTQSRHLEFFVQLAEEAEPKLASAEQKVWLDRLAAESDNWRAALRWATQSRELELGLRLAGALWRYWDRCGDLSEGRGWLERLLTLAANDARANLLPARAKGLHGLGVMAHDQGDYEQARSLYEQALTLRQELGDGLGVAALLSNLGLVAQEQSDYPQATSFYKKSLKIRQELNDQWGTAVALNNLGLVAQHQGDYEQAKSLYERSLALSRELGD
ncbi:MAG: tetratricopeptide repeat protein, partial [Chloroflexota bacterium]|nr:tetratricopeptide repeat protein [Chloroflexota bacterium]